MDITKDLLIFHKFEYKYDSGFGNFKSMDIFTKTIGTINNTYIDLESVSYQLSDYKFTPGFTVTVDDLLHPKPLDYEETPKFK